MLQMGGDFGFENANTWFKNLDVLMEAANKEGRINVSKRSGTVVRLRIFFFFQGVISDSPALTSPVLSGFCVFL